MQVLKNFSSCRVEMPSSRALPAAGGSPRTLKLLLIFADRPADLEE